MYAWQIMSRPCTVISYGTIDASPCVVIPAASSSGEGGPNRSKQRLWPKMPASSLLSALAPYSGYFAGSYREGSMDDHGGLHNGFVPVAL